MKVTLIHNSSAGDDTQPTAGQIEALIKEAGYTLRYQSSKDKSWHNALNKSADLIVVAGGDGTVGRVARHLIGKGLPIAVLPLGTANNISKTLGISDLPITRLISSWKSARQVKFDAGVARGPWGERYFIEGVGAGLLTSSIAEVHDNKTIENLNETGIKVAYAQQIFRDHLADSPVIELNATLDGEDISGRYVLFEVLNMQYIGPNLFLAPDMVRNDGEFDVILVGEKHRGKLHDHIKDWQEGKLWPSEFGARRGKCVKMEWTGYPIHIDDKLWPLKRSAKRNGSTTIEINVEPGVVEFLVPKDVQQVQTLIRKNSEKGRDRETRRRKAKARTA